MEIFSIGLAFMPILFGVAGVALFIYALIDCIKTDESQMRHLPKVGWILIIIFTPFFFDIGAILYLAIGKERSAKPKRNYKRKPTGPDDDPDFLRGL